MNPSVKAKWLEALRSGEYEQGRNALNENGNYCCLGVLCDVAVKSGLALEVGERGQITEYDGLTAYLPDRVKRWAALYDHNPRVPIGPLGTSLANLNDQGKTFSEIADLIEEYL